MTRSLRSTDGTVIAYELTGAGPALVIIGGAFNDRHSMASLVPLLASSATVVTYDRRGRGDSGDTLPWAVEREVEDLAAVIAAVGGSASLYGHSSGGALALEAAARGLQVTSVAVYEPPYTADKDRTEASDEYAGRVRAALDAGDPEGAAEAFLEDVPPEVLTMIKGSPSWPGMVAIAHTLPYDIALVEDGGAIPVERLGSISVPTLVMAGGGSDAWAHNAADAVAAAVPGARRLTLEGQSHAVADEVVAPVLLTFLASGGSPSPT